MVAGNMKFPIVVKQAEAANIVIPPKESSEATRYLKNEDSCPARRWNSNIPNIMKSENTPKKR